MEKEMIYKIGMGHRTNLYLTLTTKDEDIVFALKTMDELIQYLNENLTENNQYPFKYNVTETIKQNMSIKEDPKLYGLLVKAFPWLDAKENPF